MSLREIARCMSVSKKWHHLIESRALLWGNVDLGGSLGNSDLAPDGRPGMGLNYPEAANYNDNSDNSGNDQGGNQDTDVILLYDENLRTLARRAGPAMWRIALRFSPLISDAGIQALLDFGCINLRYLEIRANRKISNDVFGELLARTCGRLEYVALSTTEICDHVVQQLLANAPNLVHLDLSFCRNITADAFPVANEANFVFPSTAEPISSFLEISSPVDSASSNQHPAFQVDANALPRLKTLLLDGCVEVYNAVTSRVLGAFGETLCTLDLCRTKVTMWVIHQIASVQHKPLRLERLLLNGISTRINDQEQEDMLLNDWLGISLPILERFVEAVPNLTQLRLGGGNALVTNGLVNAVAQSCRKLASLDVHDSLRLGTQAMLALGEFCVNLTQLNISGCIGCFDEAVIGLANGCMEIEALDLSTLNITDESLYVIGSRLYKLKHLFLDFCRQITADGIRGVVESTDGSGCLFTLRKLSFIQCRKVNYNVVDWCKERLHPDAVIMYEFSQRR
ncbi:hypothetical protein LPJ56_000999 [Coemansia sp. RSA 2599]|nr:hypothetical protein LPJ75_002690 [Coemansia sp. RSA 2598]KAJ1828623.1 hypothetical protein LPJ56_000999 [Coemansia sp. RSA 2599]